MIWPGRPNHDIEGWDLFSKNPVSRHKGILFDLVPSKKTNARTRLSRSSIPCLFASHRLHKRDDLPFILKGLHLAFSRAQSELLLFSSVGARDFLKRVQGSDVKVTLGKELTRETGGHSIKGLDPALASVSTTGLHSTLSFRSSVLGPGIRKDGKETTTPDRCPRDAILTNAYCPTTSFRSKRSSPISSFTSAEYERKTRSKQELQQLECQGQEEAREVSFGKQAPQLIRLSERAGTYYLQEETGQQTSGHLFVTHIYSLLVKSAKRAFTGEIATSSTPLLLPVLNQVQVTKKKQLIQEAT
ncbi:unnamed protein product [Vicia faba]|uniref:Uncharacterized protein n=1 Tax=Vicia faba TaxID=3906 RepID=A0AAV1A8Z7_VICFA|nr:unnamed protein product [Vicia faba]